MAYPALSVPLSMVSRKNSSSEDSSGFISETRMPFRTSSSFTSAYFSGGVFDYDMVVLGFG
jgi:hypothetical protein